MEKGLEKGQALALRRRPCVSVLVCHARGSRQQRATSTTAVRWGFGWCCPRGFGTVPHLRHRGASLRLAAHHVHRHPATRQAAPPPRLTRPLGRSCLSAGTRKCFPGVLGLGGTTHSSSHKRLREEGPWQRPSPGFAPLAASQRTRLPRARLAAKALSQSKIVSCVCGEREGFSWVRREVHRAAANDKRGLTRLGSARRWAWRQKDRAAQRQRDGQDTHRSAPLVALAPSEKIQLPGASCRRQGW